MAKQVRVRFAPSPTGFLHLGGLRSALFNYLYARHNHGQLILRIEDTDRLRLVPEALSHILASLGWLGIEYNEGPATDGKKGPYIQSQRLAFYRDHSNQLLSDCKLYRCWCSPARLEGLRKEAEAAHRAFKYDRHCLQHPGDLDEPYVLRFFVPDEPSKVSWNDAVRGQTEVESAQIDDFVAIKSDGYPTYHFASVVDDHLMDISHVLRADEWVASTPKHIMLYGAFGWQPPVFGHLPQVLGQDKAKLSKRHGAKSALEYKEEGYLPEAVVNYLASLGFNDGTTKEIYTRAELIKAFSLERIQSSPAIFDPERLDWMNGIYIRQMAPMQLLEVSQPFWPKAAVKASAQYRKKVLGLVHDRLKVLKELPELTDFFFDDPAIDLKMLTKVVPFPHSRDLLGEVIDTLDQSSFKEEDLERGLRQLAAKEKIKTGQLFGLIRVAVTGKTAAPGLFATLDTLGKKTVLRRLKQAQALLT